MTDDDIQREIARQPAAVGQLMSHFLHKEPETVRRIAAKLSAGQPSMPKTVSTYQFWRNQQVSVPTDDMAERLSVIGLLSPTEASRVRLAGGARGGGKALLVESIRQALLRGMA